MTIVSHKHKFIFLKTMKTAGTSVEMALAQDLGEEDTFASGQIVHDAGYSMRHNAKTKIHQFHPEDLAGVVKGFMDDRFNRKLGWGPGRWKRPRYLRQHASASEVRRFVGGERWLDYWKVCFERNPWDRMLSYYFFRKKAHGFDTPFEEWLSIGLTGSEREKRMLFAQDIRNDKIYVNDGIIAVDHVFRYEDIDNAFGDILNRLGLEEKKLGKHNVGARPERRLHEFYTPELQKLVSKELALEVRAGNYSFPSEDA